MSGAHHVEPDVRVLATLMTLLARALAPELARELARQGPTQRADELVDRKSAPISKRAWDANAGREGGFAAFRDGRRVVAKRADVLAWLEKARRIIPVAAAAAEPEPEPEDEDEDERALRHAGLRLVVGRGGR